MISDNDLLLYHYGDGLEDSERAAIATALRTQPELAARLRALVEQLDAAATSPEIPVPAHVRSRWQVALEHAARDEKSGALWPSGWRLAAGAAVAVLLVITLRFGFELGREHPYDKPTPVAANVPRAASSDEQGLRWHLAATERQLAQLDTVSDEDRTALIQTVIEQNRLFAAAAEHTGDQRLARALRSFTPILETLAETPGSADSASELAQLNFELRVMQARLAAEAPASATSLEL